MTTKVIIHKGRTNVIPVELGRDITGETYTSEMRTQPDQDAALVAQFVVAVTNAGTGSLTLTLDNTASDQIEVTSAFMDLKRVSGGEPYAVFDKPLEVSIRGTVTA